MLKTTWKLATCVPMLLWTCHAAAVAESPKNVVLILADDLGYSDVGCYGSEIETPNIDVPEDVEKVIAQLLS